MSARASPACVKQKQKQAKNIIDKKHEKVCLWIRNNEYFVNIIIFTPDERLINLKAHCLSPVPQNAICTNNTLLQKSKLDDFPRDKSDQTLLFFQEYFKPCTV